MSGSQNKAVKTISFMSIFIFLAKGCGLIRGMLLLNYFGTGFDTDVFTTATRIPLLFFDLTLGAAILSTFIPVFNNFWERDGKERAMRFANNFITIVGIITITFCTLGMLLSQQIVQLMAGGFDDTKVMATQNLLQILFPVIIFTALAYAAVGILQSLGEFTVPSIISLVSNGTMIIYFITFGNHFGITGVAVAMLIGWSLQLIIQIPSLYKKGFRYKFTLDLKDDGMKNVLRLSVPILISSWMQPICVAINMVFASHFSDGAITCLDTANQLYILFVGVFTFAVTNFIFPKLSKLHANNDSLQFAKSTKTSLNWIFFIIVPVMGLFLILSSPIISVLYERGEFGLESVILTSSALKLYSIGMLGYAACEILNKSFYAAHDGKTPMYATLVGIGANIITAAISVLYFKLEIEGLALASALGSIVNAIVLFFVIMKKYKNTFDKDFFIMLIKTVICGITLGIAAYFTYMQVQHLWLDSFIFKLIKLAVATLAGGIAYLAVAYLLKLEQLSSLMGFFKSKV